jgi:thioredoxin 1
MKWLKYIIYISILAVLILSISFLWNKKVEHLNEYNSTATISQSPIATQQAETKDARIKVTFVELGSVKCIPCKMMQPIMDEIAKEYKGQVEVVFYDVWTPEGRLYAEKYQIRAIPTQVFLDKNGKEYYRHLGFLPKEEIIKVLRLRGIE